MSLTLPKWPSHPWAFPVSQTSAAKALLYQTCDKQREVLVISSAKLTARHFSSKTILYFEWWFWHTSWHIVWNFLWHKHFDILYGMFYAYTPTFFFWQPFWHSIWHLFRDSIWHLFRHYFSHIFWHSFRHPTWHLLQHSIGHSFWHVIFLASILTFYLAFFWHLFIFITIFFLSKFRFRFIIHSIPPRVHSGDEPAQRAGWRQKEGRKKGGKEKVAPLIESRDPYLAGGEQTAKIGFHQQKFCCTATWSFASKG